MEPVIDENDEDDWLNCQIENARFIGNGGPLKLHAIISLFLELIAE